MTANDMDQDHVGTMSKIILFFAFQLIKLSLIFLFSTYFLGIIFYIFCDLTRKTTNNDADYFIGYYSMDE